jgi:hypothetical protein
MTSEYFIETCNTAVESAAIDLSPLSESAGPISPLECIVEGAEQKQQDLASLIMILTRLDHSDTMARGEEVKKEMTNNLILQLHSTLKRTETLYRDHLGRSRSLRVSLICTALEMVLLSFSDETMYDFIEAMPIETLPTLVILVEIFSNEKQSVIRDVVLQKVARILNHLCTHGIPIRIVVIEALFVLLKGPNDAKIDAACAIANLAAKRGDRLHCSIIERIEQASLSLISTLSTAASSLPEDQIEDVLNALLNLASSSDNIAVRIAQRFGTLRVLSQTMKAELPEIRRDSYMIASSLLKSNLAFTELLVGQPFNGKMFVQGLAKAAVNEEEFELKHFVTCILTKSLANMNGSLAHIEIITDALAVIASRSIQERTAHEAALALCNKAIVLEPSTRQEKICLSVAELTHSSSNLVQLAAWKALQKVCLCSTTSRFLVTQETFQRAIVSGMTETRGGDISTGMHVLQQIAREQHNREAICQSRMLDNLIEIVTSNESVDDMTGVEVILLLMSEDANMNHFLPYSNLLPWLATLANSNASSKEIKETLSVTNRASDFKTVSLPAMHRVASISCFL